MYPMGRAESVMSQLAYRVKYRRSWTDKGLRAFFKAMIARSDISGFCLNLIERYSDATIVLKKYVEEHDLRLIRENFYWRKNRINDHRPTC